MVKKTTRVHFAPTPKYRLFVLAVPVWIMLLAGIFLLGSRTNVVATWVAQLMFAVIFLCGFIPVYMMLPVIFGASWRLWKPGTKVSAYDRSMVWWISNNWKQRAGSFFKPRKRVDGSNWLPGLERFELTVDDRTGLRCIAMVLKLPKNVVFTKTELEQVATEGTMKSSLMASEISFGWFKGDEVAYYIVAEDMTDEVREA